MVAATVAFILFEILLLSSIKAPNIVAIIVYSITVSSIAVVWYYTNRCPKTSKGKVGFVVSIQCSDEKQEKVIREDFVTTLRRLLKEGPLGRTFHFIETPKHISENVIDIDDAYALRRRTRAHFLVFGRVRLRILGGKECHILDLDGLVLHKPIAKQLSDQLSKEFGELFPRHLRISTDNDLDTLSFTSDWTECVAKYIIGIAAAYSSDLNYAEQLYQDAQKKLESMDNNSQIDSVDKNFQIFVQLKKRLPIRFSEIYFSRSVAHLKVWRNTQDEQALSNFALNLSKICDALSDRYEVLLLRAIEAFLNGRRIGEAIAYTKKCKHYDDPIWHFNLAFLRAYEKNLLEAIRQYRVCEKHEVSPATLSEVEDFIVWILEKEPEKYQYYYCLGFFNWKIKGDLHQSINDFELFLNKNIEGEFKKESEITLKWLSEIKKKLGQPID